MPNFFIDRPIFAWVIAIIIMLAGGLSILKLPVAQYPTIAPPAISITAMYPGADAETVQNTVTQGCISACRKMAYRRTGRIDPKEKPI